MHDLMTAAHDLLGSLDIRLILLSSAAVFAAAVLRGFTGFGFALAAVPLLGLFMSPTRAVPVAIGLQLFGSLLDFRSSAKTCHWPSLRWLMIGAVIGSPIGTLLLTQISAPVARLVISFITLLAVAVLGRGFTLTALPSHIATAVVGWTAGVFNGLAAMPGPPAVAYYMSAPLEPAAARASLLVFFLMTSITASIAALVVGLISVETVRLSLLGMPVMWIGTQIGEHFFSRGSGATHRKVSIISLGIIALISAIKGASELL